VAQPSRSILPDVSLISYSDNLAITTYTELKMHTKPCGVSSCSYRDWDAQRCLA
jgi:hypothetical protein